MNSKNLTMISSPKFTTIDDYISFQPEEHQPKLELIRQTIRSTAPDAVEAISYQMPAFKYHGMLCYFAVFKDHYSLFVEPKIKDAFSNELRDYTSTKSAIHFSFKKEIPVKLIEEIIRFTAISNLEKAEAKKSKRRK